MPDRKLDHEFNHVIHDIHKQVDKISNNAPSPLDIDLKKDAKSAEKDLDKAGKDGAKVATNPEADKALETAGKDVVKVATNPEVDSTAEEAGTVIAENPELLAM
jgi:hypothetical protein